MGALGTFNEITSKEITSKEIVSTKNFEQSFDSFAQQLSYCVEAEQLVTPCQSGCEGQCTGG